jgi:O-antigen/teichoic acid export membrane protein
MMRQGLSRNMMMSGLQSAAAIVALFVSYRLVVQALGADALGLWSLLTALTLVIRLFDPTGAATIGRFVAIAGKDGSDGEKAGPGAAAYIDTALVLLLAFYVLLALLAYLPIGWLLQSQVADAAQRGVALHVLPLLLTLMVVSVAAATNSDAIDGTGRADMRAVIMIASYFIQLALVWWLLPRFQLAGFAMAQIGQYLFVIVAARAFLRRHIAGLGWLPRHARRNVVRELVGYGAKLQLAALASVAADPLLRLLINHYGGLSLLGIYELASKLVVQVRGLLVSAMMPLIPQFANRGGTMTEEEHRLFRRMNRIVAAGSAAIGVAALAASPLVGLFTIGHVDKQLILVTAVLAAGYFANTLGLIHYLQAQASGRLRWNIIGQFSIGLTTVALGPLLTLWLGPVAVIIAFALGLALAGFIFIAASNRHHGASST